MKFVQLSFLFIFLLLAACESKVQQEAQPESSATSSLSAQDSGVGSGPGKSCKLPGGGSLNDGAKQSLYQQNSGTCIKTCASMAKQFTCTNGVLDGNGADPNAYPNVSCTAANNCNPCTLPCGTQVQTGGYGICFNAQKPDTCGATCTLNMKKFLCNNGTVTNENNKPLSDNDKKYYYTSCDSKGSCEGCKMTNGVTIPNGQSAAFFQSDSVPCGQSCFTGGNQVLLLCSNGSFANRSMYPNHVYNNCAPNCAANGGGTVNGSGGGAPNSVCPFPWGSGFATDGTKVVAFSRRTTACGDSCQKYKAKIVCNGKRGLWSGGASYIYNSCYEPKSCP